MKMNPFLVMMVATILAVPSLFAKTLSQREKRLGAKTQFKIDKSVAQTDTVDKTFFDEISAEKALRDKHSLEKTIRAERIGRELVLKVARPAKQRRNTHFREWP
jgi:hypothetical protein